MQNTFGSGTFFYEPNKCVGISRSGIAFVLGLDGEKYFMVLLHISIGPRQRKISMKAQKANRLESFAAFPSAYFGVVSDEKFNLLGISPGRKAVKAIKLRFTLTLGEVSVRKPILPAA